MASIISELAAVFSVTAFLVTGGSQLLKIFCSPGSSRMNCEIHCTAVFALRTGKCSRLGVTQPLCTPDFRPARDSLCTSLFG